MATPMKAHRSQGTNDDGTGYDDATSLAEMDQALLARLLKILERNVSLGEDLDPFAGEAASGRADAGLDASPNKKAGGAKAKKPKAKTKSAKGAAPEGTRRSSSRGRSGSAPAGETSETEGDAAANESQDVTDDQLYKLGEDIEKARISVIAAGCCIGLLAADALSKQVGPSTVLFHVERLTDYVLQLYSEELIMLCVSTIKNQLTKLVYPFIEGLSDVHGSSSRVIVIRPR